jgi:hypothetical protein
LARGSFACRRTDPHPSQSKSEAFTLGAYLSRYSDRDGYWLFGFLVPTLIELRIDLLEPAPHEVPAFQQAIDRGVAVFQKQLALSGCPLERLTAADLVLSKGPDPVDIEVNGVRSSGWFVVAKASATTRTGRRFEPEERVQVAPHNPAVERRSARAA